MARALQFTRLDGIVRRRMTQVINVRDEEGKLSSLAQLKAPDVATVSPRCPRTAVNSQQHPAPNNAIHAAKWEPGAPVSHTGTHS